VAAKPVDRDHSSLVKLANHASKLLREFIELEPADRHRMTELLAELQNVIAEFRRLRPPPAFRKDHGGLRLIRTCAICRESVNEDEAEHFETPGAVYHSDCYEQATGISRKK
jgi:hypothetical protein